MKVVLSKPKKKQFNIYVNTEQFELLQKIPKDSVHLGEISDFTLGITPYDKYKGHSQELIKSRGFHSDTKESDIYKPLISGGNIERYFVSDEIKEYIKYGEWLGAPRDERFFNSPRVLIRQIVSGKPPLLLIITAQPFDEASKLVLPKGSSHLEQTTAILVSLKVLKTLLCFWNPNNLRFL